MKSTGSMLAISIGAGALFALALMAFLHYSGIWAANNVSAIIAGIVVGSVTYPAITALASLQRRNRGDSQLDDPPGD